MGPQFWGESFVLPCLGGPCIPATRLTVDPSSAKPVMLHEPHAGGTRNLEIEAPPVPLNAENLCRGLIHLPREEVAQLAASSFYRKQQRRKAKAPDTNNSGQSGWSCCGAPLLFFYFLPCCMRPEGQWQRPAAALADSSKFSNTPFYVTEF